VIPGHCWIQSSRQPPGRLYVSDETLFRSNEAISRDQRKAPETVAWKGGYTDQQRSSVMLAILTLIYREFCLARIAEMRKL
jgi:hypothetical protein